MRFVDRAVRGTLIVLATALLALLALRALVFTSYSDLPLVAHAGGRVDGRDYTNAISALDASLARGFRFFELDFQTTADGRHVCGRDWAALDRTPTFHEFLMWRQSLEHPPCTLDEVKDWFAARPEATLVTDAKVSASAINAELAAHLPGRLVVQAYSREEMCAYIDAGMPDVVLTLYRLPVGPAALAGYLREPCAGGGGPRAVTMSAGRALAGYALAVKLSTDLPVYAHTVNDCVSAWAVLLMGADSVYTDTIAPGNCMLGAPARDEIGP